jgi:L-alanine-DL-glutamate epimerase-like enolase superfamily enzyme
MSDDLLAEPLEIVDGRLSTRQSPGIGIDPEKLARYRLDAGN